MRFGPVRVLVAVLVLAVSVLAPGHGAAAVSFEDRGDGVHASAIDGLALLGVFENTECGENLFCPDEPILRWEMAVWLARLLAETELSEEGVLDVSESRFVDVEGDVWWLPHVELLADLGVTRGCVAEPARFCPYELVSRAQMASFLGRAFGLVPPEAGEDFVDIAGSVHADGIRALADAGITEGCSSDPARFCPHETTTRAQMASFLKRAYTRYVGPCPPESDDGSGGGGSGGGGSGGGGSGGGPSTRSISRTPPRLPLLGIDVDPGDSTLTVAWDRPELPTGYSIYGYRLRWKGPDQSYSDTERWDATSGLSYRVKGLTNGSQYSVQVAAGIVGEGFGTWSEVTGVPRTEPGEPRSVRADPGDEKLTVRWQAPAGDGGSTVTGYRVQWRIGGAQAGEESALGLVHEIEGLGNGVEYEVGVAAVNAAGSGPWSLEAAGTPVGPPGVPRVLRAERGDRSVTVSWQAPAGDGGSSITGYRVQWRTGGQSFSLSSRQQRVGFDQTGHEIAGLANGTEHFVRVLAVNDIGDGDAPSEVPVTPATTPGPPRSPRAERGDRSVTVSWQAPAGDGGSVIMGYRVQWRADSDGYSPAREAVKGPNDRSHEIVGLANGTEHFVRVLAVNDVDGGAASTEASATPATAPRAPTSIGAAPGGGFVTVSWGAPDDGGSDITAYTVQWRASDAQFEDSDPQATVSGATLTRRIVSLTIGTEYFVRVRASNDVGAGNWSAATSATPANVAGSPQGVGAVAAPASVTVSWSAPADDGGSVIMGYRVQWRADSDGYSPAREAVKGPNDRSHEIAGLANGTKYFVRVLAVNDVDVGAASAEAWATPATVPTAPGSVVAQRGDRSLDVSWAAPDDGGSTVVGYRVQWSTDDQFDSSDPEAPVGGAVMSRRIASLTNGMEYWVRVLAANGVGDGPWSPVVSAVPATVPSAPRSVSAERADRSIEVGWQPPAYDGSLSLTGYVVQWSDDQFEPSIDERPVGPGTLEHLVTGLVNGTQYWVRVRAANDVGAGEASAPRLAVPATVPGAPGAVKLTVLDRSLDVSWAAPDDGGSTVVGYRVQWSTDDQFDSSDPEAPVGGAVMSRRIAGLVNGMEYWVRVLAANGVGDGPWSPVESATPATVSGVPQSVTAEPGDGSILVSWQAPADDGGSAVVEYRMQWRIYWQDFGTDPQATVSGTAHRISGLVNGSEYSVRVLAVNAAGPGPPAGTSGVPRTVPGQPGVPVINIASGILLVSWDPPESDGGSAVTGYRVQWKGPGQTYNEPDRLATVTSTSYQIAGLTQGTEYTVRIVAVNIAGSGPPVEQSAVVADPPGAPASTVVSPRNRSLFVTWSPPDTAGSSAIKRYRVLWKGPNELFDDSRCSFRRLTVRANGSLSAVVGPLDNGTSYAVRVVAVNDSGPGAPSDSSGIPAAIPGAPHDLLASAVDGGLLVDWEEPWDAGFPITGYQVQWKGPGQDYSADRHAVITDLSNLRHEITGLSNGANHQVRVKALNANGSSRYATAEGAPADTPGRPSMTIVTTLDLDEEENESIYGFVPFGFAVSWEAPADTGGSAITEYHLNWKRSWSDTYHDGFVLTDLSDLSFEIVRYCSLSSSSDLVGCPGRMYHFRVRAVNSDGTGPPARIVDEVVHPDWALE